MAQSTSRARTTSSWRQRHRPLPEREGHTVVSLLASHIADRRRLEYLEHCLVSVANQEVHVEALYLSWYATTEALAAELQALFRRLRLPFRFRPIRQQRQCSQYQHLREALAACQREAPAAPASLWVTFADDDDLWHSQRIRLVRKACTAAEREISAITFGIYAYPVNQGPHESKTVSDVKRALDSREAAMWLGPSEIFQFVVRHHVLAAYLASEPECILSHRCACPPRTCPIVGQSVALRKQTTQHLAPRCALGVRNRVFSPAWRVAGSPMYVSPSSFAISPAGRGARCSTLARRS